MEDGSILWVVSRSVAFAASALLMVSLFLGVAVARGTRIPGVPRQVIPATHRSVSLAVVIATAVHITTIIADPYAHLEVWDAVVPFAAANDRLFVGLGTLSVDLLVLIVATSLVRSQIPQKLWRGIHVTAYLAAPIALIHGVGAGTDVASAAVIAFTTAAAGLFAAVATFHTLRSPDNAFA